jgi:hypothetical protein
VSPRRYGKTSLLLAAEAAAGRSGVALVHVNVLAHPGPGRFASALATGYARTRRHLLQRGAAAIAELRGRFHVSPSLEVGDDGRPKLSFAPSLAEPDAMSVLEDVYRLLSEGERQPVLVLDEFDSIIDIDASSASVLKGLADTYPRVSLVVAGSRRRMMERLVHVHGAPLYGMTQPIALGPIDGPTMARHLARRAASGGKKMPPTSSKRSFLEQALSPTTSSTLPSRPSPWRATSSALTTSTPPWPRPSPSTKPPTPTPGTNALPCNAGCSLRSHAKPPWSRSAGTSPGAQGSHRRRCSGPSRRSPTTTGSL